MTDATDVLVVGGGLTGCATAYELARRGAAVTLLERSEVNAGASGVNAGSLHAQIQHEPFLRLGEGWARAYAPATRFLVDAIARWHELADELAADLEVAQLGGVLVAETEAQLRAVERKVAIERSQGLDVELLGRDELRAVAPYVSERMVGGELCHVEGKANPLLAAHAFARAAERCGARVLRRTELRGLRRDNGGFRAGSIFARRVVSCGGVDAGRALGIDLPLHGEPLQVSVTEPVAPLVSHLIYFAGEKLTLKQARAGSVLIGGGWPARADHTVDPASLRENLRVARTVVPELDRVRLLRTWTGVVTGTPDWRPLVGEIEPGLFVGVFPYMGFTAGPLLGAVLADLALGRRVERDLAPFAP